MANPFLQLDMDELFTQSSVEEAAPEQEEEDEKFLDAAYLENLQDISYGKVMPAEESQRIAKAPSQQTEAEMSFDLNFIDMDMLFGEDFAGRQATLPRIGAEEAESSNRIIRFGKVAANAFLGQFIDLAEYSWSYGPLSPINMLRNAVSGKPVLEPVNFREELPELQYDIPEAQTREQEIDDVAAASFGTTMSFVVPIGQMAKAGQAVKAGASSFGMLTPDVVVNVAARPSLINKLPPAAQKAFKSGVDAVIQTPVVGGAIRRTGESVAEFAGVTRQVLPRVLDDVVEEYTKTPGRAIGFEVLAASGSAYGAAVAETIAPGSVTGHVYGELLGGVGGSLSSGVVMSGVRLAQKAIKEPAQTFKNVIERFGYDQKGQLQILKWIEEAEKEYLTLTGREINEQNLNDVRAEMLRDVANIDEDLKGLPLGLASGNPILIAFENRMAKLAPDFDAQRLKAIENAYDGFYTYIKNAMQTGNPNQINRAARLQQQAMLDVMQRRVDTAKSNAIEVSRRLATTNAADSSAKQWEITDSALYETRKTEKALWDDLFSGDNEIQPRQARAYTTSLDGYNEVRFDLEREAGEIKMQFEKMRDTAEYLELKAIQEATPLDMRDTPRYERLTKRIKNLRRKYPSAGRKIKAYMNLGVSEETASMLTGNTLESIAGQAKGPIFTTKDMHKLRSRILEKARLTKSVNQKRIYNELAEALLRDLINASDNSDDYLTAINFSRALNQKWTQGFVGKMLRGKEMGSVSPETLLSRAFNQGGGIKSRLQLKALQRASIPLDLDSTDLGIGSKIAHSAKNTQEDFVRANMNKFVDNATGIIRPRALNDFLADPDNQLILQDMPSLKADLEDAQTAQVLIDDLLETQKVTKAELADAALSNFLGKRQSDKVIATILAENNATENFSKLVTEIRKNADRVINDLGNDLSAQEISALRESSSAAMEGLQYSLFRIAHDVARDGNFVDFAKMRQWLEQPVNPGEASPLAMIQENRVLNEREVSGLLLYISKGEKLQASLASDNIQASLEELETPLASLIVRIAGAKTGSQISEMTGGGGSLIAPTAASQLFTKAFNKMPKTKVQSAGLEMLKDKRILTEVLEAKLTRQNERSQYLKLRAFLFNAGYVTLANGMDQILGELPVVGDATGMLMENIEEQRNIEPSNLAQPLSSPVEQMQRRILEERQRLQ